MRLHHLLLLTCLLFFGKSLIGQSYVFNSEGFVGSFRFAFEDPEKIRPRILMYTEKSGYTFNLISLTNNKDYPATLTIDSSRLPLLSRSYKIPSLIYNISVYHLNAKTSSIQADTTNATFSLSDLEKLTIIPIGGKNKISYLHIESTRIKVLLFDNAEFPNNTNLSEPIFLCRACEVKRISFFHCFIQGPSSIANMLLPESILLDHLSFEHPNSELDLTHFSVTDSNKICTLLLREMNDGISRIRLNYENFRLSFDSIANWQRERIYRQLLEEQQKDGFTFGYEKLEKEYKQFKYMKDHTLLGRLENWIDATWWDYGYDKFRVITNSIKIFLGFLLLNLFIYGNLIGVYQPEGFKEFDKDLRGRMGYLTQRKKLSFYLARIPAIVVYSGYIFWGLKLDLKELKLRKPLFYGILLIEYIAGLVCLAYIANYIISK